MKKLLASLLLVGAMVFAVNALILTGHLSPDRFSEHADSQSGDSLDRGIDSAPRGPELALNAVENQDIETASRIDSPSASTEHGAVQGDMPLPTLPPDSEQAADLDEPTVQLASEQGELAIISSRAAIIRAAPSASAAELFAFPPGRRVRVGGHENGFARIKDLASGEVGWVEDAALGPAETKTQRAKRESFADATIERPAVSKPRETGRWVRQRGRKGGLLRRLMGRR